MKFLLFRKSMANLAEALAVLPVAIQHLLIRKYTGHIPPHIVCVL